MSTESNASFSIKKWIRAVTWDQWDAIDKEYLGAPSPNGGGLSPRNQTVWVLVISAIVLSLIEYYGSRGFFRSIAAPWMRPPGFRLLAEYAWWATSCMFWYLVLPGAVVKFVFKENLSDYGFRIKGFFKHLWIYGLLFLGVFPMVVGVSFTQSFQSKYPFYKFATRSFFDFFAWEAVYSLQFLSLEFFFRGFMLFGLARFIGSAAIPVMALPYCMIHFGKPFPETIGAIGAGLVLGTVALRTRSIYAGVLIHVAVAWSMDILSLWQKGKLSELFGG